MRHILALALAAMLLSSVAAPAVAAPKVPSGTLAITSLDARFGGAVTFAATSNGLRGYQYPLVYLACYQQGVIVYGQLDLPTTTFILGGGSSPWWESPGPASCAATLYAYPGLHTDPILLLAGPITFAAAG